MTAKRKGKVMMVNGPVPVRHCKFRAEKKRENKSRSSRTRIDFTVRRNTVGVDNALEALGVLVREVVRGRGLFGGHNIEDGRG